MSPRANRTEPKSEMPVTHSHPDDADVTRRYVTCATCGLDQAFTVPADHDGSPIVWECSASTAEDVHRNVIPAAGTPPAQLDEGIGGTPVVRSSDRGTGSDKQG